MELWIRNQEKTRLQKVVDMRIFTEQEGFSIVCDDDINNILGIYSTQKRALEILDEIQKVIMPKYIISNFPDDKVKNLNQTFKYNYEYIQSDGNINIRELGNYIYEMPKE